jgi:hypothetical protein
MDCALFVKNRGVWGTQKQPNFKLYFKMDTETIDYNKLIGSISTKTAVCGISFASQ